MVLLVVAAPVVVLAISIVAMVAAAPAIRSRILVASSSM
jgi:hypothetical protein